MASPSKNLALRPWPTADKKPKNIAEFVARINAERGGFRNVTEDSLRKEIEKKENGVVVGNDVDMGSEPDHDNSSKAMTADDLRAAQDKVLRSIDLAHNHALLSLDLISLLLSKENPREPVKTLTPRLRDLVGLGTLGSDLASASNLTEAKIQDNKCVSTGWKMTDIDRTVDTVMAAAARLQNEIELETKYWADVLAVSDSGWSVYRLPNERATLGVKFGFMESALEFRNNSVAPMRRGDDGTVRLDTGRVGRPQRLQVTIEKHGQIVGRSSMPKPPDYNAPLEARVLEARNTIFSQELWHEINREGRTLLSYNVRLERGGVTMQVDSETKIILRLQALDDFETGFNSSGSNAEDSIAESVSSALHLLLNNAHRQLYQKRSRPPSLAANQGRSNTAFSLLRPILTHLMHEEALRKAVGFMSDLTDVLQIAGLAAPAYNLTEAPFSLHRPNTYHRTSSSEALWTSLLSPREFLLEFSITPETPMAVRGRTVLFPIPAQQYMVQLPSPTASQNSIPSAEGPPKGRNPLQDAFPPVESYPNLREVTYYIRQAAARVLAFGAEDLARSMKAQNQLGSGDQTEWGRTVNGRSIRDVDRHSREIRFDVCKSGSVDQWDEMDEHTSDSADTGTVLIPELRLYAAWPADGEQIGRVVRRKWAWTVEDARRGVEAQPLVEVIKGCITGELKPQTVPDAQS